MSKVEIKKIHIFSFTPRQISTPKEGKKLLGKTKTCKWILYYRKILNIIMTATLQIHCKFC
jgi:hypothetical protein